MKYTFFMDGSLWRLRFAIILVCCFAAWAGYGQDCDSMQCHCDSPDLNPSGIMIGHNHPKGSWMFSYRYMDMQMRNNLSGTGKVSDDVIFNNYIMSPQRMTMDMHMLMAMYGITSRLSVMVMLSYNVLSMDMNMLPGAMTMQMNGMTMANMDATRMSYKTSGLGDTRLYATYTLLDKGAHRLFLSAGVNLPTGNIHLKGDNESMLPGHRLPYMMQLGSGTFDILPGLTYVLGNSTLSWGSQVTGVYHPGYNSLGYAYGDEATATSWLSYRFLPWLSLSARAELNVTDQVYGKDPDLFEVTEPGAAAKNYGGTKVNGYIGANVYLKQFANSRLSLEYGMPFYQNLNGTQLAGWSTFYAGWAVSF